MPVSHLHKAILVHIPKTAGTSMEYVLGMHGKQSTIGVQRYVRQIRDAKHLFGGGLQHMTAHNLKAKLGAETYARYFSFAFTRNPWDRVVSDAAWSKGKWVKKEPLTRAAFEAYVHSLQINAKQNTFTGHQRPQYQYICNEKGDILVDFVGRYECLAQDWAHVCKQLHIQKPLPKRMASNHNTDYRKYYTPTTRALVAQLYAKDIALFGYKF